MGWKIKLAASAREDIRNIKSWYRKQSAQALENFIQELTASIEALKEDIQEHRLIYKNYRKLSLKKISLFHLLSKEREKIFY